MAREGDVAAVEEHEMHAESFVLPPAAEKAVARARQGGGRVVAVGTTSARTLEACAVGDRLVEAGAGSTDIFL